MVVCDTCANQLREKVQQWHACLIGEDANSVENQLRRMTWDITVFRVLMEVHRLAPDTAHGGKRLNGMLFNLLHGTFSASLLLGFRRLMDKNGLDGNRGVYSLASLLKDVSRNAHVLTRSAILEPGPGDSRRIDQEFLSDWKESKNHQIDRLIGIDDELQRSPADQIPSNLFDDRLISLQEHFGPVESLVNKAIAHAATPKSRGEYDFESIPFDDLYAFHAELCRAAHFLRSLFSDAALHSFLDEPLYDQFEYLQSPLVDTDNLPRLAQYWQELANGYESLGDEI